MMQRESSSNLLSIGEALPSFSLPGVDGRSYNNQYFADAQLKLVVFTCNHCPYVKGTETLLLETAQKYADLGLKVVAISSNDALQYPEDSFVNMQKRAQQLKLPYPYLYDESQSVAKLFDAQCTPELYLFDKTDKLIFHGPITDKPRDVNSTRVNLLANAIDQYLAGGGRILEPYVPAIGCSIKWKQ